MTKKDFIDGLVPGNYFLTKSMEITKYENSGTLWYTKKFLVLYYYIFLANNIEVSETAKEIADIFDDFIQSLPASKRREAKAYFFSSHPTANLKDPKFKLFPAFLGTKTFASAREREDYVLMAKKYYMAFIMESGGQSGVNKEIKDNHLYKDDFTFDKIDGIITAFFAPNTLTSTEHTRRVNDYMAFVRNERQILFLYGFFHGKSAGSSDIEFSSLTPIGELALHANYYELIAIWEHQKIKMVSQPATIDIQNIPSPIAAGYNPSKFGINKNPYLTILKFMKDLSTVEFPVYTNIISRTREVPSDSIPTDKKFLDDISAALKKFKRVRDVDNEDFQKELKKYMFGISELDLDGGKNPLSLCKFFGRANNYTIRVTNRTRLNRMYDVYSKLCDYKEAKYGDILSDGDQELKRQFLLTMAGSPYVIDKKVKASWNSYIIRPDLTILFACCLLITENSCSSSVARKAIVDKLRELFPNLLKRLGFTSYSVVNTQVAAIYNGIENGFEITAAAASAGKVRSRLTSATINLADLQSKIDTESAAETRMEKGVRKRNTNLIDYVRKYNVQLLAPHQLTCECCGNTTFVTKNDEDYVEYHHLIPFNDANGPDHYLNLFALCPMCHRKIHFIKLVNKTSLYNDLSANNYRHQTIEDRLVQLKKERKLETYHLEYLYADNAIDEALYNKLTATA